MDRRAGKRRALELAKDVLIVLLTCSALWLAARSQLLGPLSGLLGEENPQVGYGQAQGGDQADAARPLRITANLNGGTETVRYGVQYDAAAAEDLFQQVAGLLVEALSSAGAPEKITRAQWEQALLTAPGVTLDFQGEIPMPVLVGWLSREDTGLTGAVRRLTLTVWQDSVALYYRDEETGIYYRSLSEVANQLHLEEALASLGDNGAFYAFESEAYRDLDPDTLVTGDQSSYAVYSASNPMSAGQASLEALMEDLGFTVNSYYPSGDEQVGRSGNDTVRLSNRGLAEYTAGEGGGHFQVSARRDSTALFEAVEVCRQLAAATVGARCGQAQLYLISARETGQGLEVEFGYCLNGVPVQLEGGAAAAFLVKDGQVSKFTLCFRSYTDSGEAGVVLPVRLAAAALADRGLTGAELQLIYQDTGGDAVAASWAAAAKKG